jgi:Methylase involved in ubiquinone/menaquinone biosynthesis
MELEIRKKIAASWDKWAVEYDTQYAHGLKSNEETEQWKLALKKLTGTSVQKVLDVGTGTGFLALLLAEIGHQVKGIDISLGMMAEASSKAKAKGLEIQFAYGDAENLEESDNTYDIVVNRHLLWTMQHPQRAVNEWVRVLKPGGRLIIIDGDWFYKNPVYSLKIFVGKLLVSVTELKNPWKNKSDYDEKLKDKLPMVKDENARKLVELVKKCGLTNIKTSGLEEVEKAEKKAMPLKQKLLNPHKRIVVEGIKP